ncbi:hypothetical protein [uncultured Veillonella sp.]|uniref:hypothetical protein n=1 Tax=uncultured Veillonella sp. TaxID=159268 RepID=UPI0025ED6838|nr:hypothetical protein [uncultured Veillonella sp.]
MAKFKIKKGLSDADMFKNVVEEETFETAMLRGEEERNRPAFHKSKTGNPNSQEAFYREFLTEKIETQIGKLLLEIKMDYFKDGYGDFSVQVKKDGRRIILETAPKQVKQ